MSERLVAAFQGPVQCRRGAGAVQWSLTGTDRDSGTALEVLLSGAATLQLPAQLIDAELHVRDEAISAVWELRSGGGTQLILARAVQVHRRADTAFAGALPQVRAPWTVRAGWIVLLNLLRLPGAAWLLQKFRGGARDESRQG